MTAVEARQGHRWAVDARTAGALRFAATILLIDVLIVLVIPGAPASFFMSFAVVATLWFMDFQGTVSERLKAYGIGVAAGLFGVVIGTLCGGNTYLAVAAAFVLSTAFSFARILPGAFAQAVVGPQLGLLLALLTPGEPDHLGAHAAGWLIGSVVAVVVAMLVFPRQASQELRLLLAQWCLRAKKVVASFPGDPSPQQLIELQEAAAQVAAAEPGSGIRSSPVAASVHALAAMQLHVSSASPCLEAVIADSARSAAHPKDSPGLDCATVAAFENSAGYLAGSSPATPPVDLENVRAEDAREVAGQASTTLEQGQSHGAVELLQAYHRNRIASLIAMQMQDFALAASNARRRVSGGWSGHRVASIKDTLAANLNWQSPALRDSLRIGIAVAGAVLVAKLLGLDHGFWVASVALCVSCGHLSRRGTDNAAGFMVVGATLGVSIAALAVVTLPAIAIFVLLPVAAFISKFEATKSAFIVQLTYTPFAVFNLTALGWPDGGTARTYRLQDVVVGALVAVVATFVATPKSQRRALDRLWLPARSASDDLFRSLAGESGPGKFPVASQRFVETFQFLASDLDPADRASQLERVAWLQQVELTLEAAEIAKAEGRAPDHPELLAALASADRSQAINEAAAHLKPTDAEQLMATIWSAWWLDRLAATRPR